jgi:phage terminase large subunit GpA-like protein
MGSGAAGEGGLRWDKPKDDESHADAADRSARYICEQCGKSIHDRHRSGMMRGGVWAPKGCTVDKKGQLCGKTERTCSVAGFRLSSLYSLQLTWGKIAAAFVTMRRNAKTLQMFINGWLAETWEPYRIKSEPEDVADRLATDDVPGVIRFGRHVAIRCCRCAGRVFQMDDCCRGSRRTGGGRRPWDLRHVGGSLRALCQPRNVEHADGGPALLPCLTLIDSGDGKKTDEVYRKCREWSRLDRLVLPCKGANTDNGSSYDKVVKVPEKHTKRTLKRQALRAQGAVLIRVNSYWHEPIVQRWLDSRKPEDADSLSIPRELADDLEFMRELCNAVQSDDPSKMDPDRLLWKKRWTNEANDFRDTLKYCRCAIDVKFRGNWRVAEKRQLGVAAGSQPARTERREFQADDRSEGRHRPRRQRARRERIRSR